VVPRPSPRRDRFRAGGRPGCDVVSPRDYRREGALPRFSLDRRVTVLVLFLTTIVIGAVATLGIPAELLPSGFEAPFLRVTIPYPDAPPNEVLEKVTRPLEDELSTIRGLDTLITYSSHGSATAFIKLKQGTDVAIAYREIRDRIERARPEFPDEIDHTYIRKHSSSDLPVMVVGVSVEKAVADPYELVQRGIIQRLNRVDGVAQVDLDGMEEKEILIELDRDRTGAAGLNIYEVAQDLAADNFSMSSGTVFEGSRKLLLRSVARYASIDALRERRVGGSARLGDIADIRYEEAERDYVVRALGQPAVALNIFKEGDANAQQVARNLRATIDRLEEEPALDGTQLFVFLDQDEVITDSLDTLIRSGLIGGLIAATVMFLFLRRYRMTLILGLAIPLSLLLGLTVMYFAGETLNILTLLGLMLSVGLLVDNSVVVAENIHRMRREGLDRRDACIRGAGEVSLAIVMSTLTTIVVFLPVALVEGPGQFFLMRLAIPVCVSLVGSLLVALVFIPLCMYLTLSDGPADTPGRASGPLAAVGGRITSFARRVYEAVFGRLNAAYGRMLALFLRRRLDLVLGLLLVFIVSLGVGGQFVEFVDNQEGEEPGFRIGIEMPPTTTLEESSAYLAQSDEIIAGLVEELDLAGWFHVGEAGFGRIEGWFHSPRNNDVTGKEAMRRVRDALPQPPGFKFYTGDEDDLDEGDVDTFMVTLYGDDVDLLRTVARSVEDRLVQQEGVLGLKRGAQVPPRELALVVDREQARRYDVNPRVIAGVVGYALRGTPLPAFYDDGKEIPVRVRFREEDREGLVELASFQVPTENDGFLPLSAVTDPEFLESRSFIRRVDKRALHRITVELEGEDVTATRQELSTLVRSMDFPEGVTLGANAGLIRLDGDMEGLRFAGLLAIAFVFLLMAFLFESLMLPLSILLTIPLSVLGVYWSHLIAGKDIDFLGAVGMVLLVGVVVNNGIVFIDYTHRLRAQGLSRREALIASAERRFRPIMMTAITTIGGMVPLAIAGSSDSNALGLSYTSFALTLIGGMVTATLLTLLVVPVFYTLFEDARTAVVEALGALVDRFRTLVAGRTREPARPPAETTP
jgi:HAE1 family hydrophobic/amphiphilic exporter-1